MGTTQSTRTIYALSTSSILLFPLRRSQFRALLQLDSHICSYVGRLLRVARLVFALCDSSDLLRRIDTNDYNMASNPELPTMCSEGPSMGAGSAERDATPSRSSRCARLLRRRPSFKRHRFARPPVFRCFPGAPDGRRVVPLKSVIKNKGEGRSQGRKGRIVTAHRTAGTGG